MIRSNTKATNFCDFSLELDGTVLKHVSDYKYLSTISVDVS